MKNEKNKMSKDVVPSDFTMGLAVVDLLPVVFFALAGVLTGRLLDYNLFVITGAMIAFVSGFIKVNWKIIVVKEKRNIWWMFWQMRIAMPIGLIIMLCGIIYSMIGIGMKTVAIAVLGFPQIIFFVIGIIGMAGMIIAASKLDSSDVKANWIEQLINSVAQLAFLIGVLLI